MAFPPGSEAELINRRTERLWGETLPQLDGPSVIPILAQAGEAADSWAVLTAQP